MTIPTFRTCRHPGCGAKLYRGSNTYDAGLCRKHGGQKRGKAVTPFVPVEEPAPRPGTRVAEVTICDPGSSSVASKTVRVSLPKEPWG